ncbi:MAG: SDR family NAD(P)-dependent oxidoreductase [Anaerolineales bacterium]
MNEVSRLDDKIAVVTGGGRGIGRATALTLARAGAAVAVAARTEEEIAAVAEEIREAGGQAMAVPTDITSWAAVQHLADEVARAYGPADIVVANAGIVKPVEDTWAVAPEAWAQNVDVNLTGAFYTARAFLPAMMEREAREAGVVIFVSSGAATHPVPGWSAYCAAKAGLDHFARNVASEIDRRGSSIRIHTLYPGIVDTSMQTRIRELSEEQFPQAEKYRAYYEKNQLRPPEEPATLIWWLTTPMAADFHGQAANIDDAEVRRRIAADLDIPEFGGRKR